MDRRREDNTRNHTMIYSGGEKPQKWSGNCNEEQCSKINDGFLGNFRMIMKVDAKPFNINVMQVYASTQDHDGEEIEKFYQEIQNGIKSAVR